MSRRDRPREGEGGGGSRAPALPILLSSQPPPSSKLINYEASEESTRDYFSDFGVGKDFLSRTQNAPIITIKIGKLDSKVNIKGKKARETG